MAEQPNIAILTAHGQPSDPGPQEAALAETAAAVAQHLPGWDIRSATLSAPGRLESQTEAGAVIYPFFMARGWFTGKVLPGRLAGTPCRMACPFGLDPALPQLAAEAVRAGLAERGWPLDGSGLLLAAHGSARGPKAAESARAFAASLQALLPGLALACGFVEEAPGIADAARSLPDHTLCLPFFAQSGDHVKTDIPDALAEARFAGATLPVTGALPGTAHLIARAITRAASAPVGNL